MIRRKQSRPRIETLEDRCQPSANFVLDWNNLILDVQKVRGQGNQVAARSLAIMGASVYDSVNAISPTHTVYHVDASGFPGVATASPDAAAAQAAHDTAYALYTNPVDRERIDTLLANQLAVVVDGPAETAGIALGQYVASQMLAWRATDGATASVPYTYGTEPGDWQPTPPTFTQTPATPQWRYVTPFALASGSQFRPGPTPALTSADYMTAFNEVKSLGSATSETRTPEQTQIAHFWAGAGVSNAGVMIWNQIAQSVAAEHNLSLAENARLFAQLSVSAADAFIAGLDAKYEHDFWRPVTGIRAADTDGNPDTAQDATWTPLLPTPNHQSYVSLHSTQSMAAAQALADFFGTDHVPYTATWAGVERSYNKFTDAAKEAGKSRIYGGIHWSFDSSIGLQQGRKIGQYVADHYFQPLPGGALRATSAAPTTAKATLNAKQVQPLLKEALSRWQAAGFDTSVLKNVTIRIADLGGNTLGRTTDGIIWLDDNAAGWGWFVDRTPKNDSEFTRKGNQGEQNRMDLLTVLLHETGHVLGRDHTPAGVMQETLDAGRRQTISPALAKDNPWTWNTAPSWIDDGFLNGNKKRR
jgi:hypothetical protein